VPFLHSPEFVPGATYRLLDAADGKVSMYRVVKAGGRIDSEFFPESILHQSFSSPAAYSEFLRSRHVDYVAVSSWYQRRWKTNERALLEQLAATPGLDCAHGLVPTSIVARTPPFVVFKTRTSCS
jgi:hypothetical protein